MADSTPLIVLTFFTLITAAVVVGASLLYSLRKRGNREIARRSLVGREASETESQETFDGALPELVSLMILALVIMMLLATGYVFR